MDLIGSGKGGNVTSEWSPVTWSPVVVNWWSMFSNCYTVNCSIPVTYLLPLSSNTSASSYSLSTIRLSIDLARCVKLRSLMIFYQ